MNFLEIAKTVENIRKGISAVHKKAQNIAVTLDQIDDVIFSVLDVVSPALPKTWQIAIQAIKQFEQMGIKYLIPDIVKAEETPGVTGEEKLAIAVQGITQVPIETVKEVLVTVAKPEVPASLPAKTEEEKSTVDKIVETSEKVTSVVKFINGFIKGF